MVVLTNKSSMQSLNFSLHQVEILVYFFLKLPAPCRMSEMSC